jgi:hypothetical protein
MYEFMYDLTCLEVYICIYLCTCMFVYMYMWIHIHAYLNVHAAKVLVVCPRVCKDVKQNAFKRIYTRTYVCIKKQDRIV